MLVIEWIVGLFGVDYSHSGRGSHRPANMDVRAQTCAGKASAQV